MICELYIAVLHVYLVNITYLCVRIHMSVINNNYSFLLQYINYYTVLILPIINKKIVKMYMI